MITPEKSRYQRRVADISLKLIEDFDSPRINLKLELLGDEQLAFEVAKFMLVMAGSRRFIDQYGEIYITPDRAQYEACLAGRLPGRHVDSTMFKDGTTDNAIIYGLSRMIKYVHEGNPTRQFYERNKERYGSTSQFVD